MGSEMCIRDSTNTAIRDFMTASNSSKAHRRNNSRPPKPADTIRSGDPQSRHSLRFFSFFAPRNGTFHNRPCLVPFRPQNTHCASDGLSRQQDLNGKSLEENREPTALCSPWHLNLLHSMLRTIDSRNTGVQQSLELATVKVPPLPLRGMITCLLYTSDAADE